jgi:hypothetical protein
MDEENGESQPEYVRSSRSINLKIHFGIVEIYEQNFEIKRQSQCNIYKK